MIEKCGNISLMISTPFWQSFKTKTYFSACSMITVLLCLNHHLHKVINHADETIGKRIIWSISKQITKLFYRTKCAYVLKAVISFWNNNRFLSLTRTASVRAVQFNKSEAGKLRVIFFFLIAISHENFQPRYTCPNQTQNYYLLQSAPCTHC